MIRVAIVDDHPVMLGGVASTLGDDADVEVVGRHSSAEVALRAIDRERPDVLVLDYQLPGMNGIQACQALRERDAACQALLLTSSANDATMMGAFDAGAKGFVVKSSRTGALRSAVHHVAAGGTYIDPTVAGHVVSLALAGRRATGPFGLTIQERRVLERLPDGSNAEIGRQLGISAETVKSHLRSAMRKLGVRDRAAATAFVRRGGLGP